MSSPDFTFVNGPSGAVYLMQTCITGVTEVARINCSSIPVQYVTVINGLDGVIVFAKTRKIFRFSRIDDAALHEYAAELNFYD